MRLPIYLVLLAASLIGTASQLRLATRVRDRGGVAFATAMAAGTSVTWLLVTSSSFAVTTVSNGTEIVNSYPSLGVLGVLGVGVSVVVLAKGAIELLQ